MRAGKKHSPEQVANPNVTDSLFRIAEFSSKMPSTLAFHNIQALKT